MMKRGKKTKEPTQRNLVAKYAREFNKAVVMEDKTKYNRKKKHKGNSGEDYE